MEDIGKAESHYIIREMWTRVVPALLAACVLSGCGGAGFFRAYEYEEEMYLALDGTATMYVNSSVAALNALHGSSLDQSPSRQPDRAALEALFTSPVTRVTRITFSRRSNRQFVHLRMDVTDVSRLSEAGPFSWSMYRFAKDGELYAFRQMVGASAHREVGDVGWKGDEVVAFRMHLPSKIAYHNAGAGNPKRGNILAWEQPLAARRQGEPIVLEARVESQSILYRTLALFGLTFVLVAVLFVLLVWWVFRRGNPAKAGSHARQSG